MHRTFPFFDSYWYCYANSTAMLLAASGFVVRPDEIEVLSGVGLGAFMAPGGLPFFSSAAGVPDRGISRALEILGFVFEEHAEDDDSTPPFDWLAARLSLGPVVAGPLDMSLLAYNPARPSVGGVDHYVLVSALDSTSVRVHDPAGFAAVTLSRDLFARSWRASSIAYRRGAFRGWCAPQRVRAAPEDLVRQQAIAWFQDLYRQSVSIAADRGWSEGERAIRKLAQLVRDRALNDVQRAHLRHFALPLGAKRALHFAAFFERVDPEIARLKYRQATLFGDCHSCSMQDDWSGMADRLEALGACEAALREAIVLL